jgi:hypothetical protein
MDGDVNGYGTIRETNSVARALERISFTNELDFRRNVQVPRRVGGFC